MRRLRSLVVLGVAVGIATVAPSLGASTQQRPIDASFRSHALGERLHYMVYLPPGYATSGRRYPVVYFLHGLPAAKTSYRAVAFVARALAGRGRQAILVVPQGARDGEHDPEWVDHGPGDDWGDAIAVELPRAVDRAYRTIANRSGRALVGESAGGYGAMHLAFKHLSRFSVVESWSGYFHPTDPTGTQPLDLGSPDRDAKADVHRQLAAERARLRREPLTIAFYVGRGDARFAAENEQLDRELTEARIPHTFHLYPGGHTQRLWEAHAPAWLGLALAHLAPAR
jgi:enterochelin esterase-like enzyme